MEHGRFPLRRIEIQRTGIAAMIVEGTDDKTLRRAVGRFPGSSLPGRQEMSAIAGHRDTFFRALRNIRKEDEITLETLSGLCRYRADSTEIVDPSGTEMLNNSDGALSTLLTCYPLTYVGPAPK
jgi:sortase A